MVSKKQRDSVDSYIQNKDYIGDNDFIFLAGHYPLKDLNNDTLNWLDKIIKDHKAIYLSAHTHYGMVINNTDQSLREINIDSLIDSPSSYWKITYNKAPNNICFEPNDLWEKLDCDNRLKDENKCITENIEKYKTSIKKWRFDGGAGQWRNRAMDAYRTMNDFIKSKKLSTSCEEKDDVFFTNNGSMPDIANSVILCEKKLDSIISNDENLQKYASCVSMLGSKVFVDTHKEREDKKRKYIKTCIPIKINSTS